MKQIKLSKRLCTAASFVRDGAVVADIGTDHAYIPIYLIQNNKAKRAIATDINEGPISRAKENILSFSYQDKIEAYIADGLDGIERHAPTDIVICGMGGELISDILDRCDYVKNERVNLILQPMTTALELRSYLQNGFLIYDEEVVFEDGKYYQIICATYDGRYHDYTCAELEIGQVNAKKRGQAFLELLEHTILKKKKIMQGLEKGSCDTNDIKAQIKELEELR